MSLNLTLTAQPTATRHQAFVATLAHEFRQPLSVLTSAAAIIETAPCSPAAGLAAGTIQRQTKHLTRMVEDLMDAARWASGKVTLRTRRVDVCEAVREAANDAAPAAAARGQLLVVSTPAQPLWIDADADRLQQALSNLVGNALKYTGAGGKISLEAEPLAFGVRVRVSDTGRGLEPDALRHIFELFSQVRPDEETGLGIGLSVVKEIVELHDGRIEAQSGGAGCGASFIITLPGVRAAGSTTPRS